MKFPVAIEQGNDTTAYGVIVPDLEGCFSAGSTFDEALSNAREAILLHLEALSDHPKPSDLASLKKRPEFAGFTLAVIKI